MILGVVDTSALIRLYVPDGPLVDGLEDAVEVAWRGDGLLICPEIALAETAQVIWKKEAAEYLSAEGSRSNMARAFLLPIKRLPALRSRDDGYATPCPSNRECHPSYPTSAAFGRQAPRLLAP